MKRIVIILIGLISVAYGQYQATSAKTKFVNGLSIGSKDSTYFTNAGDTVILYIGRDSAVYTKFKGSHRKLAFDGSLGAYKLISDSLFNNGYTTRARTKQVIDSLAATEKNIADTFFTGGYTTRARTKQQIDSLGNAIGSGFVTIGTTQTVTGAKTFSLDLNVNGLTIGRGGGTDTTNTALGRTALATNTTGIRNIAIGPRALALNTTGQNNTAVGYEALAINTIQGTNTAVGSSSMYLLRNGNSNTALGYLAGNGSNPFEIRSGSNSIFIGAFTKPSDTANTNETVIGYNTTGNGSNTVTIGNSSVTDNYFSGNVRATSAVIGTQGLFSLSNGTPISGYYGGITSRQAPNNSGTSPINPMLQLTNNKDAGLYIGGQNASPFGIWIQNKNLTNFSINYPLFLNPTGGNVTIGDSVATQALTVSRPSGTASYIVGTNGGGVQTAIGVAGDNGSLLGTLSNHDLRLNVNGVNSATLKTDGTFLVNTTTTDGVNKLIVNGAIKGTSYSINGNGSISSSGFWGTLTTSGTGSFADWAVLDNGSNRIIHVPTGTKNVVFGNNITVDGTTQATGAITTSQYRLSALNTAPSSASDTGTLGEIRIDANYIYVCTATNTWKRVAITTW